MTSNATHSKEKVIVVAYALGRVGSSAMMGLLKLTGLNVGNDDRLIQASPLNPKGFFELKSQQEFLVRSFAPIYPAAVDPGPMEAFDAMGAAHALEYGRLIEMEFRGRFPAAIKSQRLLTLGCLYRLRNKYDVRVLMMERREEDQVESTRRSWAKYAMDDLRKNASREFVVEWIRKWKDFADTVEGHYDFPYQRVSFERLMDNSAEELARICEFVDQPFPGAEPIAAFLDRSLVNRKTLG